jgi:uncharacterized protein with PQ loop repeat
MSASSVGAEVPNSIEKRRSLSRRSLFLAVYLASLVGPIFTIPQIWLIFSTGHSEGVSVLTWLGYILVALIWTVYGLVERDKPIVFSNTLWMIVEGLVVIGVVTH